MKERLIVLSVCSAAVLAIPTVPTGTPVCPAPDPSPASASQPEAFEEPELVPGPHDAIDPLETISTAPVTSTATAPSAPEPVRAELRGGAAVADATGETVIAPQYYQEQAAVPTAATEVAATAVAVPSRPDFPPLGSPPVTADTSLRAAPPAPQPVAVQRAVEDPEPATPSGPAPPPPTVAGPAAPRDGSSSDAAPLAPVQPGSVRPATAGSPARSDSGRPGATAWALTGAGAVLTVAAAALLLRRRERHDVMEALR